MVHAIIHNGQIEPQEPIPDAWEGQVVKITPLTPDDPLPDLEARLKALHDLGPIELDPEERAQMVAELRALDELGKADLARIPSARKP